MVSSWNKLPSELIFGKVQDSPQAIQCQLVCKEWKAPAQEVSFKVLVLHQNNLLKSIDGAEGFTNGVGDYVRVLHLCYKGRSAQRKSLEANFSHLVFLCPHVQVLTI
jgi:hypothetical protein